MQTRLSAVHAVPRNEPAPGFDPMYAWACDLFPIPRSLSGDGVRQTLQYLHGLLPDLKIRQIPTGTKAFDWVVPNEWNIRDAFVLNENGDRVIDFKHHNLHVVGYSEPVDRWMSLNELDLHLHSLPDQPEAIPYVTSYYKRDWGFCLSHRQRQGLEPGMYRVAIDSTLQPGVLDFGELLISGESTKEVLLSTYICHPSMANNELSGPVVTASLARWLAQQERRFTYRVLFLPETIGAIYYLSCNLDELKKNTVAGFVVNCVGDERAYSMVGSRLGGTLADRVLAHVIRQHSTTPKVYSFLSRGSDERQYCSPGVDLPVVAFSRSKSGDYPEYHTSLDDLSLITQNGLEDSFRVLRDCIEILEVNKYWRVTVKCEPQLGLRNLYPNLSIKGSTKPIAKTMNVMAYADGAHDIIDIAETVGASALEVSEIASRLALQGLVESTDIF